VGDGIFLLNCCIKAYKLRPCFAARIGEEQMISIKKRKKITAGNE
jgi:hypothetical protein